MKIKYTGIEETRPKSSGCPVCGARVIRKRTVQFTRSFKVPSGKSITFRIGHPQEVSQEDGEYLKNFSYQVGKYTVYPFVEVK